LGLATIKGRAPLGPNPEAFDPASPNCESAFRTAIYRETTGLDKDAQADEKRS